MHRQCEESRLARQPPGAPESDRGNRQHHPGQLPISNFLDDLYHASTPFSVLITLAVIPATKARHMPLGHDQNSGVFADSRPENERIRTGRTVRL